VKQFERNIDGQTLRAVAESGQAALVEDIFTLVERLARRDQLRQGMRFRFGWTMLTIEPEGDAWMLCEPDFDRDPLVRVRRRIDVSLDVMAKQAAFAHAQRIEPLDACFDQIVIAGRGALGQPNIQAFRDLPDAEDSGWSITVVGAEPAEDPDAFEVIQVYRLLRLGPELLPLLVLPVGYGVICKKGSAPMVLRPEPDQ
jgi:hypothetical protein